MGVIQNYAAPSLLTDAGLCCSRLEGVLEQQQKDHRIVLNYTPFASYHPKNKGPSTRPSSLPKLPEQLRQQEQANGLPYTACHSHQNSLTDCLK